MRGKRNTKTNLSVTSHIAASAELDALVANGDFYLCDGLVPGSAGFTKKRDAEIMDAHARGREFGVTWGIFLEPARVWGWAIVIFSVKIDCSHLRQDLQKERH